MRHGPAFRDRFSVLTSVRIRPFRKLSSTTTTRSGAGMIRLTSFAAWRGDKKRRVEGK